jgi:hypothetical protein
VERAFSSPSIRLVACAFVALAGLGAPREAYALPPRPRFEPTDLLFEDPGDLEIDLQFGPQLRPDGNRLYLPDFELDFGLRDDLEIDLDGAFAEEGFDRPSGSRSFAADPLWTSVKVGLVDISRTDTQRFALGAQLGPRLPIGKGVAGVGYEALVLAGYTSSELHLVVQGGFVIDPGATQGAGRPTGFVGGVDVSQALGKRFTVAAEVGTSLYTSHDPHELNVSLGSVFTSSEHSSFSVVVLGSLLERTRALSLLVGFAPKVSFF